MYNVAKRFTVTITHPNGSLWGTVSFRTEKQAISECEQREAQGLKAGWRENAVVRYDEGARQWVVLFGGRVAYTGFRTEVEANVQAAKETAWQAAQ